MILLSILIPAIPRRTTLAEQLWRKLEGQIGDLGGVELLMLRDNKTRTVGAKRQTLLEASTGKYVAFVDDDDDVSENYVSCILKEINVMDPPDIIVWPFQVTINGGNEGLVIPKMKFVQLAVPEYAPPVTYRPPHHLCCWKREIAIQGKFPDIQHGEDFAWARQIWPLVKTEAFIGPSLYHYRWDKTVTEAEPV